MPHIYLVVVPLDIIYINVSQTGGRGLQGDVKLKSGGREVFKYLKKIFVYIADVLKKLNKLPAITMYMYIMNKYLLLPTPNYKFCHCVLEP
jgi:hypothetical protein